jgi:hypothetical protein
MPSREIALVGEGGQPIGSKPRASITPQDTCHSVFVLVATPQKHLLLRRLHSGNMSATGTAIRLAGESATDAAMRAVPWATTLHHLGDQLYTLPKQKTYGSVFYAVANPPEDSGFIPAAAAEITSHTLTPAFAAIWTQYKHLLPIA